MTWSILIVLLFFIINADRAVGLCSLSTPSIESITHTSSLSTPVLNFLWPRTVPTIENKICSEFLLKSNDKLQTTASYTTSKFLDLRKVFRCHALPIFMLMMMLVQKEILKTRYRTRRL